MPHAIGFDGCPSCPGCKQCGYDCCSDCTYEHETKVEKCSECNQTLKNGGTVVARWWNQVCNCEGHECKDGEDYVLTATASG